MGKTMSDFCHLHVHTCYSLLRSTCRISDLARRANNAGLSAVAVTDTGHLGGAAKFCRAMKEYGIKPIIGCEIFVEPTRHDHPLKAPLLEGPSAVTLLCRNKTGFRNLLRLTRHRMSQVAPGPPPVALDRLEECSEGLIALTGGYAGMLYRLLSADEQVAAQKWLTVLKGIFGRENLYAEIQEHSLPVSENTNPVLAEVAADLSLALVATNDVHYLRPEDQPLAESLFSCASELGDSRARPHFLRNDQFYLKSGAEMTEALADYPNAVSNTRQIADRCDGYSGQQKKYWISLGQTCGSKTENLERRTRKGLRDKYGNICEKMEDRLNRELAVVRRARHETDLLLIADLAEFCRRQNITATIRGPYSGSVVAHGLGLTPLNPMEHGLCLVASIGIRCKYDSVIAFDVPEGEREKLLRYLRKTWGKDHIAQSARCSTMHVRECLRMMGTDCDSDQVDKLVELCPRRKVMDLESVLAESPSLKKLVHSDSEARDMLESAIGLQGIPTGFVGSTRIVISDKSVEDNVPTFRGDGAFPVSQWSGEDLRDVGAIVIDVLERRALTIIQKTLDLIAQNDVPVSNLNSFWTDPGNGPTYDLLSKGETTGICMFSSPGVQRFLRRLKPECFEDLLAACVLYRPVPLERGIADRFIDRGSGERVIEYPHPALRSVLGRTRGMILYGEQMVQIAQRLAGMDESRAIEMVDNLLAGKDTGDQLIQLVVERAVQRGVEESAARRVADMIQDSAIYVQNRSAVAGKVLLAYRMSYLKANYPTEFQAAASTAKMTCV